MKHVVLALSGGMDSTCLLMHYLANGYQATCISYVYGQKHAIEIEKAKEYQSRHDYYIQNDSVYVLPSSNLNYEVWYVVRDEFLFSCEIYQESGKKGCDSLLKKLN